MDNNIDNKAEENGNIEKAAEPKKSKNPFGKKVRNTEGENADRVPVYKKRSFKYGSLATVFTAIFVAVVILLNIGLSALSSKVSLSVDLTKSKDYGLSSTTTNYLKNLKQNIVIKVFATKAQMEGETDLTTPTKIMEQYPYASSKITIDFIDYDKNPTAVAQYSDEDIQQGDIIVSTTDASGKEHYKKLGYSDLLVQSTDQETQQTETTGNKAEQQIDSAIDYVTSTSIPTILVTQGHSEADSSSLQNLLKTGNYNVKTVNLATTAIDSSASGIAIVAPQSDFTTQEISSLDKFLKNDGKYGKSVYIFFDPRLKQLPNLEEYVSEWGIKVDDGAVYDKTNSADNNSFNPIASDVDTSVAGSDISTTVSTAVRITRPLTLLFDTKDVRTTKAVITTSSTSQLLTNLSGTTSSSDKKGPFTVMALSTWTSSDGSSKSNMIVSGSYEMTDSDLLSATNMNNSKVLLGIVNNLTGKKSSINVAAKTTQASTLSLTTAQRGIIVVIFMILIPLAVLGIGLAQWLRRRHL